MIHENKSLDNHLSRVAGLKVDGESEDLVGYTYVGEARYVKIAYPEPGIELSYIKNSGEPERDSGDPYTGYDRFGRTVDMKWQTPDGATMLDRVQYGYDRSSSRTWRRDLAAPAGHDEYFRYDALHQVTDLARGNLNLNQTAIGGIPVFEENFDYDPTGNWNRYRSTADGTETLDQTRVNNRDNQITQLDGSNEGILYDRAGQSLQMPPDVDGDWSQYYRLVWDAWGRLVQVKDGSLVTVATYAYDGTTRRITKTVGGTTSHCYYNERWKVIEEREGSSTDASRQYLWGARPNHRDELVRSDRDTTGGGTLDERLYCVMDYYDPITMTDASGDVVERYEFSAFGLRSVMDGAWAPLADTAHAVEFAFHGQFLDTETGYYNYGYRYYSPQIGRWLSKDPIGEMGGVNLYAFVLNNAVGRHDRLGLHNVSYGSGRNSVKDNIIDFSVNLIHSFNDRSSYIQFVESKFEISFKNDATVYKYLDIRIDIWSGSSIDQNGNLTDVWEQKHQETGEPLYNKLATDLNKSATDIKCWYVKSDAWLYRLSVDLDTPGVFGNLIAGFEAFDSGMGVLLFGNNGEEATAFTNKATGNLNSEIDRYYLEVFWDCGPPAKEEPFSLNIGNPP